MISPRTSFADFCSRIIFIEPFKVIITISPCSCKYPGNNRNKRFLKTLKKSIKIQIL